MKPIIWKILLETSESIGINDFSNLKILYKKERDFCRKFELTYLPFGLEDQFKNLSNKTIDCDFSHGTKGLKYI